MPCLVVASCVLASNFSLAECTLCFITTSYHSTSGLASCSTTDHPASFCTASKLSLLRCCSINEYSFGLSLRKSAISHQYAFMALRLSILFSPSGSSSKPYDSLSGYNVTLLNQLPKISKSNKVLFDIASLNFIKLSDGP
jgi:hypothetical protein